MTDLKNSPWFQLAALSGDRPTMAMFTLEATIDAWMQVERALACAQSDLGIVPTDTAERIAAIETTSIVARYPDLEASFHQIGYPILPLLRAAGAGQPDDVLEFLHLGATTQDIMDTGLALQLGRAAQRTIDLVADTGNALLQLATEHRNTVMLGRTHAQPAVPTTFAAKCAVWLSEMTRHLARLTDARTTAATVQLFGAGGTSAALGLHAPAIRTATAHRLGLADTAVPWHTARDRVAGLGFALAITVSTCSRIAREVVALARPEIGELGERADGEYGASSTMPQKSNPILSETIIGLGVSVRSLQHTMLNATQVEHERSSGEWQAEWDTMPRLCIEANSAVALTARLLDGLVVHSERMRANLAVDGGMAMAEAVMIALTPLLGRAQSHHEMHRICSIARAESMTLEEALKADGLPQLKEIEGSLDEILDPENYLGEVDRIVDHATDDWHAASEPLR